jgi:hypothetical protein
VSVQPRSNPRMSEDEVYALGRFLDQQSLGRAARVCKTWHDGLALLLNAAFIELQEDRYAKHLGYSAADIKALRSGRHISLIRLPICDDQLLSEFSRDKLSSPLMRIENKPGFLVHLRVRDARALSTVQSVQQSFYKNSYFWEFEAMDGEEKLEVLHAQIYKQYRKSLSYTEWIRYHYMRVKQEDFRRILENTHPIWTIDGPIKQIDRQVEPIELSPSQSDTFDRMFLLAFGVTSIFITCIAASINMK